MLKFRGQPHLFQKLEKAVAVSGISSGVLEENSGENSGKMFPDN